MRNITKKGTSLVELVMYVAIMAILLVSIISLVVVNNKMKKRNLAILEVETNGKQIMQTINQALKNAKSINSPVLGNSSTSLSIITGTDSKNPTIFDLSGNKVRIKEGSSAVVNLNSDKVNIANLSFKNAGQANTLGSIAVQFSAAFNNTNNSLEENYSKIFYDSASPR